ncbi:MAG: anion permease [Myxococcaceae bacterium]|nr:anion permease [Myxococcaceae bacterium]
MELAVAIGMVLVANLLLSTERIPIEVSSIAIVVLLVVSGLSTPKEALAGFSSDTAIFLFALVVLAQGLGATGVMQMTGRRMLVFARVGRKVFIAMLLAVVCLFSSVASNTAVTAGFLPMAMASAEKAKIPHGELLMPLAFASILGGTITPFGTSTNLVSALRCGVWGFGRSASSSWCRSG